MKQLFICLLVVLFLADCANYYQYKYLKNINPNKKKTSFQRNKQACEIISQKRAGIFNNLTYTGTVPSDKITMFYEKCMYRNGWRKK